MVVGSTFSFIRCFKAQLGSKTLYKICFFLLIIKLFHNQKGNRALQNMEILSSVLLHILMVDYIYIYIFLLNITSVLH